MTTDVPPYRELTLNIRITIIGTVICYRTYQNVTTAYRAFGNTGVQADRSVFLLCVNLTFGKTFSYLSMTGNLESTANGAKMVFQANKLLAFMKKVASIAGKNSAEVAAITKLADNYDNFKVGFKLTK